MSDDDPVSVGPKAPRPEVPDSRDTRVPRSLDVAAAYAWRLIVIGAVVFALLALLAKLEFVFVAVFVGMIVAALLGPFSRRLSGFLPRGVAVAISLLLLLVGLILIFTFIGSQVAGQWTTLSSEFDDGITQIRAWLRDGPLGTVGSDIIKWADDANTWLLNNRNTLAQRALGEVGRVVEVFAGIALALFSAIFFMLGGDRIWDWVASLFPKDVQHRVDGAGQVAWNTFAGYTRGIVVIAATNAILVCIALLILQVPLALPLSLLVFFGTFIPIVGAPIAMIVAAVVALAARGPLIALAVIVLIALIGQFEGHVLQPLVMSRAVSIHPLAVALAVASGTVLAGVVGAVIAVPVVSVIYAVVRFWTRTAPAEAQAAQT